MFRLLQFIIASRAALTFIFLEIICVWLIAANNNYQGAHLMNTSSYRIGKVLEMTSNLKSYLQLRQVNQDLANENASLRTALQRLTALQGMMKNTTPHDSLLLKKYRIFRFTQAKVINNATRNIKNFITLDKGKEDGVRTGMAVISPTGAVGKVKYVSSHYSVVSSLLNVDNLTSCTLKRTGHEGTVQWEGKNPLSVKLNYIPRHIIPMKGDSVVTSQYNSIFPANILVGLVSHVNLRPESSFYDIDVTLMTDFTKLHYVEVVIAPFKAEQDSIEQIINPVK